MNFTQLSQFGGYFGAGAGFLALLGSIFASVAPPQKLELVANNYWDSQTEIWPSLLDAHLAAGSFDELFQTIEATDDNKLKASLVEHIAGKLESKHHVERLATVALGITHPAHRASAFTRVASRQTELELDASATLEQARLAAVTFNHDYGSNSLRYQLATNRKLWPIHFAVAGTTFAFLSGIAWHYRPEIIRRRRRIGF